MARPQKQGLDYFPFDVIPSNKIELIESEFGLKGFAIIVKLLQNVYQQGYYCEWNKEVALLFSKKQGLYDGGKVVEEILNASIKWGMFNENLYEKYGVLTSIEIQQTYFEAVSRRKQIQVDFNILLVNVAQICNNSNINSVNVDINAENVDINAQSKVNKSKVKESKEDKSVCQKYGEYAHVLLTDKQLIDLKAEYPNYLELITHLDEYIEMKGYKARNHYLAIKKWVVCAVLEKAKKTIVNQTAREYTGDTSWLDDLGG